MEAAAPTARRYPPKVMRYARELWERGRSIEEIRQRVAPYAGATPSWAAVRRWVDDDYAEAIRLKNRLRMRKGTQHCETASEVVAKRVMALRQAGLSFTSIAAVLRLDFGIEVTSEQVRWAVRDRDGRLTGRAPRRAAS